MIAKREKGLEDSRPFSFVEDQSHHGDTQAQRKETQPVFRDRR